MNDDDDDDIDGRSLLLPPTTAITATEASETKKNTSHSQEQRREEKKKKKKSSTAARHRLLSINRDIQTIERIYYNDDDDDSKNNKKSNILQCFPIVPNQRCGSWYVEPSSVDATTSVVAAATEAYFKSTDGHVNIWEFSLKRLNLALLKNVICTPSNGGCIIVDSSKRKLLPDSFSRTIPIWATVLNRIRQQYFNEFDDCGKEQQTQHKTKLLFWDTKLYTPTNIITVEEHQQISNLIDLRVETLYQSHAIVDPKGFVDTIVKTITCLLDERPGTIIFF